MKGLQEIRPKGKLGVVQLTLITYFLICAGPYGIEETVRATGPFVTLVATAALPILLSFPLSLICSELGSVFPERGSTVVWGFSILEQIEKHRMHSKVQVFLARLCVRMYSNALLIKAAVLNAIPPALICGYLESVHDMFFAWYWRYVVAAISLTLIVLINFKGIDMVGAAQWVFMAIVLTPVVLFCCMSAPFWRQAKLSPANRPAQMDYGLLFSNLVWQCTGFDQSTNMSGEVWRPQRTFPAALMNVVLLVILSFFMPILCGVMIQPDHTLWTNGAFSQISLLLPGCQGGWLQAWFIIAGAMSSLSVLNAYVTCSSRELYCNASRGAVPFCGFLGTLRSFSAADKAKDDSSTHVPFAAILAVSALPLALSSLSFERLLMLGSFMIASVMFFQLIFYVYARHGFLGRERVQGVRDDQFHIKGGPLATVLIVSMPILCSLVLWISQGWAPLVVFGLAEAVLLALWGVEAYVKKRRGYKHLAETSQQQSEDTVSLVTE